MDESKPWYTSTAIWASILQMGVGVAVATGVVNSTFGTELQTQGPALLVSASQVLLGLWGFYGRYTATRTIGSGK